MAAGHEAIILSAIKAKGFEIVACEKITLTAPQAMRFYVAHTGLTHFPQLVKLMSSGPAVALRLRRLDAVGEFMALCGPEDSVLARKTHPRSLRALFGTDAMRNCMHCSPTSGAAQREAALVFGSFSAGVQRTMCLIKPDAVAARKVDDIMQVLGDYGFRVLNRKEGELTRPMVQQWLGIRGQAEGVAADPATKRRSRRRSFSLAEEEAEKRAESEQATLDFLTSGTVVCLSLEKEAGVLALCELCGDEDSSAARAKDQHSLRALFGTDDRQNAVYCSPSPRVAAWELSLFFDDFLAGEQQAVCVLLGPAVPEEQRVLACIRSLGLQVQETASLAMLSGSKAMALLASSASEESVRPLLSLMNSGPLQVLRVTGDRAIRLGCQLFTPTPVPSAGPAACSFLLPRPGGPWAESGAMSAGAGVGSGPGPEADTHGLSAELRAHVLWSASCEQSKQQLLAAFDVNKTQTQLAFLVLKPHTLMEGKHTEIAKTVCSFGFEAVEARRGYTLTPEQVDTLCEMDSSMYPESFLDGPCDILVFRKWRAVNLLKQLCGPNTHTVAKSHPTSLRARFSGEEKGEDAVFCPLDIPSTRECIGMFFPNLRLQGLEEKTDMDSEYDLQSEAEKKKRKVVSRAGASAKASSKANH